MWQMLALCSNTHMLSAFALRPLAAQGVFQSELAKCRIQLDSARLLVLHAAAALDRVRAQISGG